MRSLLLLTMLLTLPAQAQDAGVLTFDDDTHAFGLIPEDEPSRHVFRFTNTGEAPLQITEVSASCGCTAPSWTRRAVTPGDTGHVAVVFRPTGPGPFRKRALVTTDGEPRQALLTIEGEVRGAPVASASGAAAIGNVVFAEREVDLGTLQAGTVGIAVFRLENLADVPVRITQARTQPGVTAEVPTQPLVAKSPAEVRVLVAADSLGAGAFRLPIVLATDDAAQPDKLLRVRGTVE